jgi:NAD(P)-dependent dehydrogenase (short-subunit alcohol dehydrogenase family)/acyl carrier protein
LIAEVAEFTVQLLSSQHDMLLEQWVKVRDMTAHNHADSDSSAVAERILLITNLQEISFVCDEHDSRVTVMTYNINTQAASFRAELRKLVEATSYKAVVLMTPRSALMRDHTEENEAEIIQSDLITTCLVVQSVALQLHDRAQHAKFYVFTFNAFPALSGSKELEVNPAATAIWGLLRTVVSESVFSSVMAVELHRAVSDKLTEDGLFQLLHDLQKEGVDGFPEVLIENGVIYVNQIMQGSSSHLQPTPRPPMTLTAKEVADDMILLSPDVGEVTNLYAVKKNWNSKESTNHVTIRVDSFAQLPSEGSFPFIANEKQGRTSSALQGYVLLTSEVCGVSEEKAGQKVAACFTVPVGPVVSVPNETLVDIACIPDYRTGDLSKIVLLWSLAVKVLGHECTILACKETLEMALAVKLFCRGLYADSDRNQGGSLSIEVVMVDDLGHKECCFSSCILSLIYVDLDLMTYVAECWRSPERFVSVSLLVSSHVLSYMNCILPAAECHLVDTQSVLRKTCLLETVPKVRSWVEANRAVMSDISRHLHSIVMDNEIGQTAERESDDGCCMKFSTMNINTLLHVKQQEMGSLQVTLLADSLFDQNGIYLVVGGLTGLGWLCVQFMAENGAGHIAIINRRAPSEEQKASMNEMKQKHGCHVQAFQADIARFRSLEQALEQIKQVFAANCEVRGVFNGAAVLEDHPFKEMQQEAFERVLAPKVKGTWNLHTLTKDAPLDFFVTHSSVASVLGNHGQANYSAANAFMDGLVNMRVVQGLAAQSINWGPMDTGLLLDQPSKQRKLLDLGFYVDEESAVMDKLSTVLSFNQPQVIPTTINRDIFGKRYGDYELAATRFHHLTFAASAQLFPQMDVDRWNHAEKFQYLEPGERLANYSDFMLEVTRRALSKDLGEVMPDTSLHDAGLDSITAIQLHTLIERYTGLKLSIAHLLAADVTASSIAQHLDAIAESQNGQSKA